MIRSPTLATILVIGAVGGGAALAQAAGKQNSGAGVPGLRAISLLPAVMSGVRGKGHNAGAASPGRRFELRPGPRNRARGISLRGHGPQ